MFLRNALEALRRQSELLELETHCVTADDLSALPASLIDSPAAAGASSLAEVESRLRAIYCSTTGYDFAHIFVPAERRWLRQAVESGRFRAPADPIDPVAILDRLTQVEAFEKFLHRSFPGATRFSIEGLDMLVPVLDEVIVVPRTRGVRRLIDDVRLARTLRRARFDIAIDLHGGPRSSLLTRATAAPQRIGYDVDGRSWLYTRTVPRARDLRPR